MSRWLPIALACCAVNGTAQTVRFNRDIRPIFSDRCYTCHGPSVTNRLSKLRLDSEQIAKQYLPQIVARISAGDKPMRMPPAFTGPSLSPGEIDLIERWIAQGAMWEKHW